MPIPTLVAQAVSAVYNPAKDLFLYFKGQRQDVKDLEERLSNLIRDLISIKSRKKEIDRTFETCVTTEKNDEYEMMEINRKHLHDKYTNFKAKYERITSNLPSIDSELDVSAASNIIEELNKRRPQILTVNFWKLAKLSRDIEKLNKRIKDMLDRLKPENMTRRKETELVKQTLDDDIHLPGIQGYVDEVLRYLSENGRRVGVVGPAGVGKTTVLTKLYNHVIHSKSLSVVVENRDSSLDLDTFIRTNYPRELESEEKIVDKLQTEIMVQLKINHERTGSIIQNANIISTFLCQKKYILLMDDVTKNIDLDNLGIQQGHENGKVVIASSERKAISSMIEDEVKIQKLSQEDSRKLFQKVCGEINSSRIRDIADRIIECCGGLPQEIKCVAKYLKGKEDEGSWNHVKQCLQSHSQQVNFIGLGGLDNFYKEMYEKLGTVDKKCLLYGALFPNEIYKDYLIECWMAERFIDEFDVQKLRLTRDHGQSVLDQLTDKYLLEWCSDNKYVKMPPNFRRVAREQKYPDEENCVIWVPVNYKKPNEEIWRTAKRMSLIGCKSKLPESPECSNIYTLELRSKPELEGLADPFFLHMKNLRVLDLHHTEIGALPASICMLVSLRSLCLTDCFHRDKLPPEAADLKKLEFLDICGTSIPSLPQEIKCMVELRCLRASFPLRECHRNSKGKGAENTQVIIPLKIISGLKKLEELSIDIDLHSQGMINVADELAMEMASLEYLTTLRFNFPNVRSLNKFVSHSRSLRNKETCWGEHTLRSFKIFIGCHETQHPYESDISEVVAERRLRLSKNENFSPACKKVLNQTSAFELIGNDNVQTLSQFDLKSIQVCVIEGCHSLRNIVDNGEVAEIEGIMPEKASDIKLQKMEKLYLYDLQLLHCIWEGPVSRQNPLKLTVLKLNRCPKLTRILDPQLACLLSSLKHLTVENCSELSQIVEVPEESNDQEQIDLSEILNKVEIFELSNLPKLQSVCKNTSMKWNSLKAMAIIGCKKLSNLSLTETNARMLASIECEDSWWTPLQLPGVVKQRLHPFCRIKKERETSTFGSSTSQEALSNTDSLIANGRNGAERMAMDNDFKESKMDAQADGSRSNKARLTLDQEKKKKGSPFWKATCGKIKGVRSQALLSCKCCNVAEESSK